MDRIGAYLILGELGSGGMGSVFKAYHPDLDRRVAVKLLKDELDDSEGRARLLREAQAMARLDHPNVVGVHDVGKHGDRVYVVMDLIEGQTLKDWINAEPRPWRQVLAMFVQAGQGLVAAHSAGIVHRDFKPSNVLVGKDGRPRVTDFGLARDAAAAPDAAPEKQVVSFDSDRTGSRSGLLSQTMTLTGAILGTPRYMAPEQFVGRGEAASDQFAFCVALYEALYGEPPFAAGVVAAIGVASVSEGVKALSQLTMREGAKGKRVPRFVRRALSRGLAGDPLQRFPSMESLLAALARDPAKRLLSIAMAAGVAVLVGTTVLLSYRMLHPPPAPGCEALGREWAGIWDAKAHAEFADVFKRAGREADGATIAGVLDNYTESWSHLQRATCERSAVTSPAPEVLDGIACLENEKIEVASLVEVLTHAEVKDLGQARATTSTLTPVNRCADRRFLAAMPKAPADPQTRPKVTKLRIQLAKATTEAVLAPTRAIPQFEDIVAKVREIGYRPLEAETLLQLAMAQDDASMAEKTTRQTLRDADAAAEAGAAEVVGALIDAKLAMVTSEYEKRPIEAGEWVTRARARLERIGGDRYAELRVETAMGSICRQTGDLACAVQRWRHAHELAVQEFGPKDPRTLWALYNLVMLIPSGWGDERDVTAAIEQFKGTLSPFDYGMVYGTLADTQRAFGHFKEAEASLAESERIRSGVDAAASIEWQLTNLLYLADLQRCEGRAAEGLATARRALALARSQGEKSSEYILASAWEGVLAEAAGQHELARQRLQPVAEAHARGEFYEEHMNRFLTSLAEADLSLGDARGAQGLLKEAVRYLDAMQPLPGERAEVEAALATAGLAPDGG